MTSYWYLWLWSMTIWIILFFSPCLCKFPQQCQETCLPKFPIHLMNCSVPMHMYAVVRTVSLDPHQKGFPAGISGKGSACQRRRGRRCEFPAWVWKSPWRGAQHPTPYSCLENPLDKGAWWATVHEVAESQTRLKRLPTHTPRSETTLSVSTELMWSSFCL